jgi:hypothetical protein
LSTSNRPVRVIGTVAVLILAVLTPVGLSFAQSTQPAPQRPPGPPAQMQPLVPGQPPQAQSVPESPSWSGEHRPRHWGRPAWGPPPRWWYDPPYYGPYYPPPPPWWGPVPAPVWVPGHWVWNGWNWVWQPGYWRPY